MIITVLAVSHVVIALAVSGHVLLNKGDVRSAIGWIGLVWFSPLLGPAIYFAFGINRVARRASRIGRLSGFTVAAPDGSGFDNVPLKDHIRTLAEVGDQITTFPLTEGNAVSRYHGGDEAYPAILDAIANARRSIALSSYIFRPDRVGTDFINALVAAHSRGVNVRVLVDAIGSGYFNCRIVRQLHNAGIPADQFMHDWLPWRMSFINLRNHKKLIVIDGRVGFAGGLNLGIENIWTRHRKRKVNDIHFRLDGPVVRHLMASFAEDWFYTTGEELDGDEWWPTIEPAGTVIARGVSSGPDEDIGKIETIFAAAIGQAKQRIRIVTPYFLPDQRLKSAIGLATLRGVEIELFIPARSDHSFVDWAMRTHLAFFPIERMKCYLTPEPFDHSKLVTVDGSWCAFGSANWDVRSLRLNFEFLLECYDEDTTKEIDLLIDKKIPQATRLERSELAERPLAAKLRDASARLFLPYL